MKQFINEINAQTKVDSLFLIKRCDVRSRKGEQYAHITVVDKTGTIEAKFYGTDAVRAARSVKNGRVYRIIGVCEANQIGELYIYSESKDSTDALLAGEVTLSSGQEIDFIYTPANILENANELQKIVSTIQNTELRIFTACCLDNRFYECPAAIRRHHEYTGGLCEHTLETVKIALKMVETIGRTKINRDMIIAGAVLHDIGKVYCFDKSGYGYVPNDTYNLIEHITMGIMHIDEYKSLISEAQLLQLRHIIQSHHGTYGDVIPLTAEAWLVHHADSASASLRSVVDDLNEIPNGQKKKGLRSEMFLWKAV
ncbi:MAG: HD domain-containing protein [Methanocorpusculum sp.]|nr:HD domain-containing protein [Methanocorpusculum sp.]